jgi:hypothetical protein
LTEAEESTVSTYALDDTLAYTCPHCSARIQHLICLCHATVTYTYTPGKPAGREFGPNEIDDVGDVWRTECPVCHEEIDAGDLGSVMTLIDDPLAVIIAQNVSGDNTPALTRFIKNGALVGDEFPDAVWEIERLPGSFAQHTILNLLKLKFYIEHHGIRGPQPGWRHRISGEIKKAER